MAWLDLVVTGLFVLPPVALWVIKQLLAVEVAMFGPARMAPLPDWPWLFFISLMGILGVVWAVARLIVLDDRLCRIDAVARIAVAALIGWGLWQAKLPFVFGAFIFSEILGTLAYRFEAGQRSIDR